MKTIRKFAMTVTVIVQIFLLTAVPVDAGLFGKALGGLFGAAGKALGVPDIDDILGGAEKRYHVSQESVRDIGEVANVGGNKTLAPEVQILFAPNDPQPGQKITARAFAKFFKGEPETLYYTWYLKRARCGDGLGAAPIREINGVVEEVEGEDCDYNDDGVYDVQDWKIEAARVLAGGGFDIQYADDAADDSDTDQDGYVAYPGGDRSRSSVGDLKPYFYYLHDFNSGKNYEIVRSVNADEVFNCPEGKVPVCVANKTLTCPAKQITRGIDRDRRMEIEAEGGKGGKGGDASATGSSGTAGGGDGGDGGSARGEQESTTIVSVNITSDENTFNICSVVGIPECPAIVEERSSGGLLGSLFEEVANSIAKPECDGGAIPVCVPEESLEYTIDEQKERQDALAELRWLYIARGADLAGDPKAGNDPIGEPGDLEGGNYVVEPNEQFIPFQCNDEDINALQSFWPPPRFAAAVVVDGVPTPITAEELDNLEENAIMTSSDTFVLDRYYSCEAELYGVEQFGVESTGKDIFDESDLIDTCNPQPITQDDIERFHLFPRRTGDYTDDAAQVGGVDGAFPKIDEDFYYTDPFDNDTSENGVKDEATVVGLGQMVFSWIYTPGDQVGVVVEGESILPTKHRDSSNMIMFATVNNACDYSGMVNNSVPTTTGAYKVKIKGYDVSIPAIAFADTSPEEAFNRCLSSSPHALVSPTRGGAARKLDIELTVEPNNPVNDEVNSLTGNHLNMGDTVTITATILNAKYPSDRLRYRWRLYKSADGTADFDPRNWRDGLIAGGAAGRGVFDFPEAELSPMEGNGLSTLRFKLNLHNDKIFPPGKDVTYLRARVEIEEAFDLGSAELHQYDVSRGLGEVIFRVTRASNRMLVYTVRSAAEVVTSGGTAQSSPDDQRICEDNDAQLVRCPVVKNQLLKIVLNETTSGGGIARYTNYRWKLNGRPVQNPYGIGCSADGSTNISSGACLVLPVQGDVGTKFTVSVSANSIGQQAGGGYGSGAAVDVSRTFQVVAPYVSFCDKLSPTDPDKSVGACTGVYRKKTQSYTGDSDAGRVLYSDQVFLAYPKSTMNIVESVHPRWIAPDTTVAWFMESVYRPETGDTITVDGTKRNAGESTNIKVKALYQPTPEVRDVLRTTWQMTDQDLAPIRFEGNMQIEYTENPIVRRDAPGAFMAAIGAAAPGMTLFLFRIFVSVAVVVVLMMLLWRMYPVRKTPRI